MTGNDSRGWTWWIAGLLLASPLTAQVRAEADRERTLRPVAPVPITELTRETFLEMEEDRRIVHEGREITVGELRAQMEEQLRTLSEWVTRAARSARRRLEERRRQLAEEQEGLAEREVAAAQAALEALGERVVERRPVRRRVLRRRDDGG